MHPKSEIVDLTCCRALFAAWVFVYHVDLYLNFSSWLGPAANLIRHGYLGVDGFFILSGLVLMRTHGEFSRSIRPFSNVLKFWGRRLARLYPVHLATIAILGALFLAARALDVSPRDPAHFSSTALVDNLLLIHGWGMSHQGAWNYPSWSISTEWAGYLLFPLLAFLIGDVSIYVAAPLAILGQMVLGLILFEHHYSINLSFAAGLLRFFPEFIMGMAMWRIVPVFADVAPTVIFAAFSAVFIVICVLVGGDFGVVFGLWLLLYALTAQEDGGRPPMLDVKPLHWLGLRSYSFYMSFAVAELILSWGFRVQGWTPRDHALLFALGMLAITLVLAVLLYHLVEGPCRRGLDRWLGDPVRTKKQPPAGLRSRRPT